IAGGADERAELVARVRQLVADAAKAGYSADELVELIRGMT
ncbi:GntR family transcriptional regulator, partial [Streptomyces rubellomurinus subsp. indigoferus]